MRPTNLASHMRRNSGEEAALAETNGLVTKRRLAANLLYCCGNCALPAWRDFVAVTDYGQPIGEGIPPKGKPLSIFGAIPAFNEGPPNRSGIHPTKTQCQ